MKHFLYQVGSLSTRLLNVVLLGSAHMTTSARAYSTDTPNWQRFRKLVDFLFSSFESDHCKRVWDGRVARAKETLRKDIELRLKR